MIRGKKKRRVKTGGQQRLGEDARTVGGLERGQRRRMMADERRIKDQENRIKARDASFI